MTCWRHRRKSIQCSTHATVATLTVFVYNFMCLFGCGVRCIKSPLLILCIVGASFPLCLTTDLTSCDLNADHSHRAFSIMDDLYYLEPGFDLNTLTVPRLRSILVAHDVQYPSSAKKGDLVEIIQDELLPQARKLLKQRDRVRRTSRGITDVPSSQGSTFDEEEAMPPPPLPKTPRGRKSRSELVQDEVEPTPRTGRRSKTPSTRKTAKTPRISESETDTAVSTRKSRKSNAETVAPTPATVSRVSRKSRDADESPFTQDNPFQQGSSPIPESKPRLSTSRPRKSIGNSSTTKSVNRRRTRSPTLVKREEFEFPVSHLSTGADNVEVTEEFTEDARQELALDLQTDRRVAKARNNAIMRSRKKPKSTTAKVAPWTVFSAILASAAGWYRQEKVAVGYCGIGQPEWSLGNVENVPAWLNELGPQCEPCPNHATCYSGMKVECDHDFVLREHPLSLNGLVPLPPTCEPDSAKEKKIEIVTQKAIHELRENTAEHECGVSTTKSSSSTTVVSPVKLGLSEEELKARVSAKRRKAMPDDEFEDLFNSALGVVKAKDEVVVTKDK